MGYKGRFDLDSVRKFLKISSEGATHDALNDAKVAAKLFNTLVSLGAEEADVINSVAYVEPTTSTLVQATPLQHPETLASSERLPKSKETYELIPGRRYVAVDLKTTGPDSRGNDRIIQIVLLDISEIAHPTGSPQTHVGGMATKLNPQRTIPADASAKHKIYDLDVAESPLFSEHADAIFEFIGDAVLVGHNVQNDINFLNAEFGRQGQKMLHNDCYCTLSNAKVKLGKYGYDGQYVNNKLAMDLLHQLKGQFLLTNGDPTRKTNNEVAITNYGFDGQYNLEAICRSLGILGDDQGNVISARAMLISRLFNVLVRTKLEASDGHTESGIEINSFENSQSANTHASYFMAGLVLLLVVLVIHQFFL